jgi:RecA/RadA recombinase
VVINLILPSGVSKLDRLFDRGLPSGLLTHVFGEAASGKTTFALQFVGAAVKLGARVMYINAESTSPVERLEQITGKPYRELERYVSILVPHTFEEQGTIIEDLDLYSHAETKLVVVDTLTRLYRTVLDDKRSSYVAHRELNRQAELLKGLAKNRDISIIVLNQVRAQIGGVDGIEPVAKSILDYWSDYVFRLRSKRSPGERLIERLAPGGDPSTAVLQLTPRGFTAA